jgi:hypothetical protein
MSGQDLDERVNQLQAIALVEDSRKKERAESWSREQENILKIWAEKAAGYRWLHENSARHYRRLNNKFMYPQIILSTVAGMGGIGITTNTTSNTDSDEVSPMIYLGYGIAAVNIITALLISFQKFMMSAEKSQVHSTVGRQFATFYRNITLELSLNPADRTECIELCKTCKIEYERLMNVAPSIPQKIVNEFKQKFPDTKYKPDIANGLSDMQIWEKTEETKAEEAFLKMRSFYKMLYNRSKRRKSSISGIKNIDV